MIRNTKEIELFGVCNGLKPACICFEYLFILFAVCSQMQKVILNLVIRSFGADNFVKAETALRTLRMTCVIKDPSVYSDWVVQFRDSLIERGKRAFWDILVEGKYYDLQISRNMILYLSMTIV